jgi:hypothetical protein
VFTFTRGFINRQLLRASNPSRLVSAIGRFTTGQLLVAAGTFSRIPAVPRTLTRDTIEIGVFSTDSASVVWLGRFPNASFVGYSIANGPVSAAITR